VTFALGEDRDQHVGAGDLLAAGGLHVDHRALDHPLEAGGGLGVLAVIHHEAAQLVVHVVGERGPQRGQLDVAGAHHPRGLLVIDQAEQQVLKRGVFMFALVGVRHGAMQGFFELAGK
jgi:hypothetical protein